MLTAAPASPVLVEVPPLPDGCVIWRWQAQILRPAHCITGKPGNSVVKKGAGWGLGEAQGTVTTGTPWLGLGLTST